MDHKERHENYRLLQKISQLLPHQRTERYERLKILEELMLHIAIVKRRVARRPDDADKNDAPNDRSGFSKPAEQPIVLRFGVNRIVRVACDRDEKKNPGQVYEKCRHKSENRPRRLQIGKAGLGEIELPRPDCQTDRRGGSKPSQDAKAIGNVNNSFCPIKSYKKSHGYCNEWQGNDKCKSQRHVSEVRLT